MKTPTPQLRNIVGSGLLALAGLACSARTAPQPESMVLAVQNSSDFQVNVFAVPSAPSARIRLGSVPPLSSGQLTLPSNALAPGATLKVLVDPVGSTSEWLSPEVAISSGTHPCLHVLADVDGDLRRSTLYPTVTDGSACP